ncbi:phosphotyrosine protein phosphatase [Butyrivibrio proteoclasticus B316]|uniref:protein-tyrosine-phosphatase n=1 Tax=Butyrivibrio proteoclasticus (strain ATCC 51982 / DSM 14932 / B316) TaxID=515622 RepID=E0RXJ2_BUTPB|nr:low molecular weight protein-tyrosine-phosphatase [Butyrivibrio proteoclasticus]ADL34419.1 phosphotyrosine protein phosphatase [Butyrivibrio proteoclasticus B316]
MIRILFVCHGNICRSTMAEFIMKDIVNKQGLADAFHIESSATHTDEIWNGVGSPVYPPARAKLREHGIGTDDNELGVSQKRARLTSRTDYDKFDFIIGMDSANIRNLNGIFGGDPDKKIFKMLEFADRDGDVADPWYTGNFDATWRDCSDGCHGLFRQIMMDSRFAGDLGDGGFSDSDDEGYYSDGLKYDDFPRG